MTLGEKIRRIRLQYGLSQKIFAVKLECTQSFVSAIEQNKCLPSFVVLKKIIPFYMGHKFEFDLFKD